MLDKPEKTYQLLAVLKAAVPYEVELTPSLITHLQSVTRCRRCQPTRNRLSYAGDEGRIVCHIVPKEGSDALIVSLTHVRAHRSLLFATEVFDYQKHKVKKLKKRNGT